MRYVESQLGRPSIVAVRQRQPYLKRCISIVNPPRGNPTNITVSIENSVPPRMLELPALLDLRSTVPAQSAAVSTKDINGLQHDDVWGLGTLVVLGCACLVEQF